MKETTEQVDAVRLTEKVLAEEIVKDNAKIDRSITLLIASHMDKRDNR